MIKNVLFKLEIISLFVMKFIFLKYNIYLVSIILIVIMSSCTKGGEPVPMTSIDTVSNTNDKSAMREGDFTGQDDGDGDVSIIGGDNNEDDDDSIIGGDDNEDDDVDIVGGDIIIGGGLTGGSSDGGKGGN